MSKKLVALWCAVIVLVGAAGYCWNRYLSDSWASRKAGLKQEMSMMFQQENVPLQMADTLSECLADALVKTAEKNSCPLDKTKSSRELVSQCALSNRMFALELVLKSQACADLIPQR